MAFIKVPDRYREGLAVIAKLDEGAFGEAYEALKLAPNETPSQKELAAKVAVRVKAIGAEEVKKLVDVLTSLYQVRSRANVSAEKLADDIYDAIQKEGGHLVRTQDASEFKSRLGKFLNLESLNVVASKARELQTDVERAFCDARMLTDLRPIFGSALDAPTAMIVVHTLKLAYHDSASGSHEEFFVALDAEDITKLKTILDRAEKKAKSLVSTLNAAGIKTVDLS